VSSVAPWKLFLSLHHRCGAAYSLWSSKIKKRREGVALDGTYGYLGYHLASKPMVVSLDTSFGTSSFNDLHVWLGRLIFSKLSLPHDGMKRCSCTSLVHSRCVIILEEWHRLDSIHVGSGLLLSYYLRKMF
jgi:hypothetical protein